MKKDTEDLFIYDNDELFNYDEITPEDKKFIMDIIDRTDFNSNKQIFNVMRTQLLKLLMKLLR